MKFDEIRKVLIYLLFLNWLVAFSQIFIGIFTGALSILANGLHSFFDGLTNVLGIFGIRMAKKPVDDSHPYGYRKYEAIIAWIILAFLTITVYEVGKRIVERIINPWQPEVEWFVLGVLGVCVVIDYFVARYEYKKGKELKSTLLVADAQHTKTHYITTGAVILGVLLIKAGAPPFVDPVITAFVLIFLCHLIYEVFKEASAVLSDQAVVESELIKEIVESVPGVESCHRIRTRGDETHVLLDIHLVLNQDLFLREADQISRMVRDEIRKEIPEVKDITAHLEIKNDCQA